MTSESQNEWSPEEDDEFRREMLALCFGVVGRLPMMMVEVVAAQASRATKDAVERNALIAIECVNIYRRLEANDGPRPGDPFQLYEGPKNPVVRGALGLATLPVTALARLALGLGRPR